VHDCEVWRRWMVFAALLPYAVHHDHRSERAEEEQRRSRERAHRLLQRIPLQRARSISPPRREVSPREIKSWSG
jgi:hypothetical protein